MKIYYIKVSHIVNKQVVVVPVLASSKEDALLRIRDYPYHSDWYILEHIGD